MSTGFLRARIRPHAISDFPCHLILLCLLGLYSVLVERLSTVGRGVHRHQANFLLFSLHMTMENRATFQRCSGTTPCYAFERTRGRISMGRRQWNRCRWCTRTQRTGSRLLYWGLLLFFALFVSPVWIWRAVGNLLCLLASCIRSTWFWLRYPDPPLPLLLNIYHTDKNAIITAEKRVYFQNLDKACKATC